MDDMMTFKPRVDIIENGKDLTLIADMPGVDENSVEIELEGRELTIHGRFAASPPEGYATTYREYRNGNFERRFTLGNSIDREGIKATVKDGVLRLILPKVKDAQPKRIKVVSG